MANSLSNLVNNLAKGIHKIKYKYRYNEKKHEAFGIEHTDCDCFLEQANLKNHLKEYKILCSTNNHQKILMKTEKSDLSIHTHFLTMILIKRKGAYLQEYMNVKFIETSLLEKENFYSQRNVEEITNTDCTLVKKIVKILK